MRASPADPTISVIVPVHNGGVNFDRCLSSLAEALLPPKEIIVVADGDTDGSFRVAEAMGAQVLRTSIRGGPARARNLGACTAQGDILFFIDADVAIPPDAMGQITTVFRHEPGLAAVFGSYDAEPAATNFLSQYKNLLHHYIHQTACAEASTFWGACGAIRRDIFFALGGFDERYRQPSVEDIELGYRLHQAGHKIRLYKALQVKHLKRWDVASLLNSDFFYRALPWTELILRHRRFINDLNLRDSSRVSVMVAYGLVGAFIAAWWWPGLLAVAAGLALALLALNAPLYRFFQRKRGVRFALQSIPWHLLYYLYSGAAFATGVAGFVFHGRRSSGADLPEPPGKRSEKNSRPKMRSWSITRS